jgi:small subunit ribosomal protein S7
MPRKREIIKRAHRPDVKYNDPLVGHFVNALMWGGKKSTARGILYRTLDILKEKTKQDPLIVFKKGVDNVRPQLEVKSRRVGGATYQVPIEVRSDRQEALALRWIIGFARGRKGKAMQDKLAEELIDAFNGRGAAIKKKEDVYKMAEANKAFAHYRW